MKKMFIVVFIGAIIEVAILTNLYAFLDTTKGIEELEGVRNAQDNIIVTAEYDEYTDRWCTHAYDNVGFGRCKMRYDGGSYPGEKGMIYAFEQTWYKIDHPIR